MPSPEFIDTWKNTHVILGMKSHLWDHSPSFTMGVSSPDPLGHQTHCVWNSLSLRRRWEEGPRWNTNTVAMWLCWWSCLNYSSFQTDLIMYILFSGRNMTRLVTRLQKYERLYVVRGKKHLMWAAFLKVCPTSETLKFHHEPVDKSVTRSAGLHYLVTTHRSKWYPCHLDQWCHTHSNSTSLKWRTSDP